MTTTADAIKLHDRATGAKLRDASMAAGIIRADEEHANWSEQAFQAVRKYASVIREFTCFDVREYAERDEGLPVPSDRMAWGTVMRNAATAGVIAATTKHIPSRDPSNHARPVAVWRSLVGVA